MNRILIVEDEPRIASLLARGLEQAGYFAESASTGDLGLQMAAEKRYNLLILDVMLPGKDGWQICEAVRNAHLPVPILMLTARDTVPDRIKGLDLGADDYLTKPFDFQELLARVRALLRRETVHRRKVLEIADLAIDTAQRRVIRAGQEIALSHREYQLLEALASHESHVLSREQIQESVWQVEDTYSNTVDVCIKVLRKKIDAGHRLKLIQTIRGVGYSLRPTEAVDGAPGDDELRDSGDTSEGATT